MLDLKKARLIKRFIAIALSFFVTLAIVLWLENNTLEVTHYTYSSPLVSYGMSKTRAVVVSDLHSKRVGFGGQKLSHEIKQQYPDIIFITGDIIDGRRKDFEKTREFLENIKGIAPIYYVRGNHEHYLDEDELKKLSEIFEEADVNVLCDEARMITLGSQQINLVGVDDLYDVYKQDRDYYDKLGTQETKRIFAVQNANTARELVKDGYLNIILCHRPDMYEYYSGTGNDLVLSGHSHGGQIRSKFVMWMLREKSVFKALSSYNGGMWQQDSASMVVSRGIGNSVFPFRINNNPELVVISFEKS